MKNTMFLSLGALALMAASTAQAESLAQAVLPVGTTSAFNAIGTFNVGNDKARLEAAGQATVQGGNPGNGWWGDGSPTTTGTTPVRSWEVIWNDTTGVVNFNVFTSDDWTGSAAMSMTRTPALTPGNKLVGLDIGGRLTSTAQSVKLDNIKFNDGSGFVDVNTAEATYSGNSFFNNYHALTGTPGNFTLRGTTLFPTGTTTGDSMRFFVEGKQGVRASVPDGGTTLALLGGALVGLAALRRKFRG